ncbi:hypothetical protein [Brevibacillus marinus]|uniref:hypothetical protein n=1 Tax=Brevibacillus marinus TaxID=2496837 RepID=UPI000F843517|nr:hypothetical protein [Brevibacillus marinus]
MEKYVPEIPPIDVPDEITHVNRPEIEETTPHPQTPNPQAGQPTHASADSFAGERESALPPIGFRP